MPHPIYPPTEYLRPWKLVTFAIGLGLLILGAHYTPAPDWDRPISVIMASAAYLTAPWSMHIVIERRWRHWPLMLLATWFSVDGCYALYWSWVDPQALAWMRDVNWRASLSLYALCGLLWYYRGSLGALSLALRHRLARHR